MAEERPPPLQTVQGPMYAQGVYPVDPITGDVLPAWPGGGGSGGDATAANQVTTNTNIGATNEAAFDGVTPRGLNGILKGLFGLFTTAVTHLTTIATASASTAPSPVRMAAENSRVVDITLTLTATTYTINTVLFDTQVITNACRANDQLTHVVGVQLVGADDQGQALDLIFFSENTSLGTENNAPNISDPNALNYEGFVHILTTDYIDLGGVQVADKSGFAKLMKPKIGTRDLYVAGITRGTPTHTGSGITLRIFFED